MASANVTVVNLDDDDDVVPVTPPSSRSSKRSRNSGSSDPFSSSPRLHKRLQIAAAAIDLETPPPPRPRPSSAPKPPVHVVVDDDDDTDPSLIPNDDVADTPDSVLARVGFSETPELGGPRSIVPETPGTVVPETPGTVVPETPGFTSSRSGPPPAAHRSSSAGPAHKSSGDSSVISLDSDDDDDDHESDEALYKELAESLSDTEDQNDGTTSYGQPLHADLPCEESTPPDTDVGTGKKHPRGAKKQQNEEEKLNRQEAKRRKEEEKAKQAEERKQKQQEKKAKKAELAEAKKKEKEISKWESGKYALKCITVEVDRSVANSRPIGGILLTQLAKGYEYDITKNPIEKSILWKMKVPDDNRASVIELPYVAIVLEAEEFCNLVNDGSIFNHIKKVPGQALRYIARMTSIREMEALSHWDLLDSNGYACEQSHYKNKTSWTRPPVEQVLCKLATHYVNVHSRQCIDEAEVAEHLAGLTYSLATCKFRKQLSWLSVNANGAVVPDNFIDKDLARKDTWLKSLIAIPGVQAKCALAIWKEYRCMRSLLNVYMDPSKTVTEKERLLSDLKCEDPLRSKRVGPKCSKRVYRMLMAENGDLCADIDETGA
ncbi:hypothetical protein EJB05_39919 [Eragrostis curvula]|uniref:ERCC4 domain-containing protein n=1 Tax=Eragrostis curvula TaxID=38414 RepID=A0A5J9TYD8_9POAL|nr:hypothetical protein EJB05_39919 [Eragrostis curvula]